MEWKEAVKQAIENIVWAPYRRPSNGVSEHVKWENHSIIKPSDPISSYCSGAQFQVFVAALKLMGLENTETFDKDWIIRARYAAYVRVDIDEYYRKALPGFLIDEGIAEEIDINEAEYGDILQIYKKDDPVHAVIASDRDSILHDNGGTITEHPSNDSSESNVIWTWSSNYSQKAEYGLPSRRAGHMHDWFAVEKDNRRWSIARVIL